MVMAMSCDRSRKKWQKVLYKNQGVSDNYVDESFLEEMKKNLHIRTYEFWAVVRESNVVMQQIYSVWIFVAVYFHMRNFVLTPQFLFEMSSAVTIVGYIVNFVILHENALTKSRWKDGRTMGIFLILGFSLSPILMTLTKTISTDTIYAMTFFMLLANLLFHDYGTDAAIVSQAFSLNAAIFASICLASRLPTTWHAFSLVTFAFELFALWPILRRNLKIHFPRLQIILSYLLGSVVTVSVATVSSVAVVVFLLLHLFITILCPAWLIRLQPYKNNIHGPWDEAVIKE